MNISLNSYLYCGLRRISVRVEDPSSKMKLTGKVLSNPYCHKVCRMYVFLNLMSFNIKRLMDGIELKRKRFNR